MQRILRFLLVSLTVLLIFFLGLPWVALLLDHKFRLIWRLPFWIEPVSLILILGGILFLLRYSWLQIFPNDTESKLSGVPTRPVEENSLIRSLNFAISGLWLCGIGLACLLRSPCLIGIDGIIMITGILCISPSEEPASPTRFVMVLLSYVNHTPCWIMLLAVVAITAAGLPAISVDKPPLPRVTDPGILVQIRCKPGTSFLWEADFNQHIRPAIEDVILQGNTYTGFQLIKSTLPSQPFDFILLYTGKSFAALDKPVTPPQYVALFQREGTARALVVLKEMLSYEDQVTVTLTYIERAR
jgi:hypothetical protein